MTCSDGNKTYAIGETFIQGDCFGRCTCLLEGTETVNKCVTLCSPPGSERCQFGYTEIVTAEPVSGSNCTCSRITCEPRMFLNCNISRIISRIIFGRGFLTPLFYEEPPLLPTPPLSNFVRPSALFVSMFLWLNRWLRQIWCVIFYLMSLWIYTRSCFKTY